MLLASGMSVMLEHVRGQQFRQADSRVERREDVVRVGYDMECEVRASTQPPQCTSVLTLQEIQSWVALAEDEEHVGACSDMRPRSRAAFSGASRTKRSALKVEVDFAANTLEERVISVRAT